MKNVKSVIAIAVLASLVGCKSTPTCDAADTKASVLGIINTNICDNCVSDLALIREVEANKETGAKVCSATVKVTSGFFQNDRDVFYIIETTTDGQAVVTVKGLPRYFNMSGR